MRSNRQAAAPRRRTSLRRRALPAALLLACLAAAFAALALPAAATAASPWHLLNPVGPQQTQREDLRAVCALDGGTAWDRFAMTWDQ